MAFEVWLVHGRLVRDRIDVDFTMGGNPARYPRYVPSGELWIDAVLSPRDVAATVVHEVVETLAMQRGGLSYGRAHGLATAEEARACAARGRARPPSRRTRDGRRAKGLTAHTAARRGRTSGWGS